MQETRVQSLGWKDPLKKEMATHFSILTWKIPWKEEPDRLQSMGSQKSHVDLVTKQCCQVTLLLPEGANRAAPSIILSC